MTEDQEKNLFVTLDNLVHGVNGIRSDVRDVKIVLDKHSQILGEHSRTLGGHTKILEEHSLILGNHSRILEEHGQILGGHTKILGEHTRKLDEHSSILNVLVAKVDSIAETVMTNDKRLSHVEKAVDDLGSGIH